MKCARGGWAPGWSSQTLGWEEEGHGAREGMGGRGPHIAGVGFRVGFAGTHHGFPQQVLVNPLAVLGGDEPDVRAHELRREGHCGGGGQYRAVRRGGPGAPWVLVGEGVGPAP